MKATMVDALGWALIHSGWQCAAIAMLFAAVNLALRRASANLRYMLSYSALLAMPAAAVATFVSLLQHHEIAAALPTALPVLGRIASVVPASSVADSIAPSNPLPYLAMVVWFWLTGVVVMSVWSAAGWLIAQRVKRQSKIPLPEIWQSRLAVLAGQLGINRCIQLCESTLAQVPAVIGWIRPVILVPAGALINLSADELEAILAHELAHIRRFDYVANLLQSAIEALMFYHPGVWWIGRRIRSERENCCDDLAIAACGDRVVYARALTALEELRGGYPRFAMAATSGPLLSRVRRLLGKDDPRRRSLPVWMALATVLVAALAVSSGIRLRAQNTAPTPPQPAAAPAAQVVPAKPRAPRTPKPSAKGDRAPVAQLSAQPQVPEAPAPEAPTPEPPTPAATVASSGHREGYLAGLVDAGYTQVSVDDIISLRENGVDSKYIQGMLRAGFGTPSPKDLINLHNNGVSPEYARHAVATGIPNLNVERMIHLAQNGVDLENVQRIHALGFGPFNIEQLTELHNNGVSASLFEALKESGYTKVDAHQAVQAQQNGLSARSLRNLREQGFKGLTFEQVIKLCRAGVI
jgi:beta-lactamase regulating signal transducer with metallopeptidase domain